jgi:hypothetical protein
MEGSATFSSRCGLRAAGEIGPSVCKGGISFTKNNHQEGPVYLRHTDIGSAMDLTREVIVESLEVVYDGTFRTSIRSLLHVGRRWRFVDGPAAATNPFS